MNHQCIFSSKLPLPPTKNILMETPLDKLQYFYSLYLSGSNLLESKS